MGIILTRIEIGGRGAWRSYGPWLGFVLVAVVLPVLVLPLLLATVLLAMSAPAEALPAPAGGGILPGGRARISPRGPPLA